MDTQMIEIMGRNRLIDELLRAGLGVIVVENIIRGLMGLAPTDTNTYSREHPHRP